MVPNKINSKPEKILLIRFSSFGDVLQTLSVVTALRNQWPHTEIHWITRSEFSPLISSHPHLTKVWSFDKNKGLKELLYLSNELYHQKFDLIYDAHNNLRSHFLCLVIKIRSLMNLRAFPIILRRSIKRGKRFLLFNLRINLFQQPFSGQRDLLEPLSSWGIPSTPPPPPQLFIPLLIKQESKKRSQDLTPFVAFAPSAAYKLKRWPVSHWSSLIEKVLHSYRNLKIVLLGGKEDHFLSEFEKLNPQRVFNFAGKLSYIESAAMIAESKLLIANDTGLLHVGEQLGHPTIALMGPAPFGFPCRKETTKIMELHLSCRPCSKHGQGQCHNKNYHWCLVGITPEMVYQEISLILKNSNDLQSSL